jgi:ABC-type sugar transport system permease subunit
VQIYNEAFQFFNYTYASALAVVGLLLSILGTALFVLIERRLLRSR